jgi:hypothetical protein
MPIEWPWKRWARERREREEFSRWYGEQQRALVAGEEIEPPWIVWPKQEPWWGGWREGNAEGWFKLVWLPFWRKLGREEKLTYLEKWGPSPDWRHYALEIWGRQ